MRDEYSPAKVCYHVDMLRDAGIPTDDSSYNRIIRTAAAGAQSQVLKSIVDCDLHPDTFEDANLQERLLASYCENGDHAQMERTFTILQSGVSEGSRQTQRMNLLLRCHVLSWEPAQGDVNPRKHAAAKNPIIT